MNRNPLKIKNNNNINMYPFSSKGFYERRTHLFLNSSKKQLSKNESDTSFITDITILYYNLCYANFDIFNISIYISRRLIITWKKENVFLSEIIVPFLKSATWKHNCTLSDLWHLTNLNQIKRALTENTGSCLNQPTCQWTPFIHGIVLMVARQHPSYTLLGLPFFLISSPKV